MYSTTFKCPVKNYRVMIGGNKVYLARLGKLKDWLVVY